MPGSDVEQIPLMANAACRKVWNRDFNENPSDNDRLSSFGGWMNPRVDDLGPLHPYIRKEFETRYQFNPADRPKANGLTDEQLKEVLEPEEFDKVIKSRDEMIARYKERIRKQT
ncbi:hypothetical protein ACEPPN_009479 [Leptodophora sp. 'Broadleaf-Isolate-01']